MDDFGSLHADTHVWPLGIVEPDNPFQYASAFIPCRYRHLVKPFNLQYSVRSFCDGVFQRVATLGHADANPSPLQLRHIFIAAILTPTIRVTFPDLG